MSRILIAVNFLYSADDSLFHSNKYHHIYIYNDFFISNYI